MKFHGEVVLAGGSFWQHFIGIFTSLQGTSIATGMVSAAIRIPAETISSV